MLKIRIMPTLLFKDLGLVKGKGFDSWRRVGSVMQSIKVYNMREVDELIFLDISATDEGRRPDFVAIDELADECFMPLTVGGGVRALEDFEQLLKVGADKVAINTAAVEQMDLIAEAARTFGSQCVVVSIDARRVSQGKFRVFTHSGKILVDIGPVELARRSEQSGAGEILLTSIDRDGTMEGYDIDLIREVAGSVSVPVIASGGAGTYEDFVKAIEVGKASAVAAASIFHFTHQTPLGAKQFLASRGYEVRL